MKRCVHIPNLYAFAPPILGPAAAIAWQEGHSCLAGVLGIAFVVLVAGGCRTVRVYWR